VETQIAVHFAIDGDVCKGMWVGWGGYVSDHHIRLWRRE
jgi:hypothetical protein